MYEALMKDINEMNLNGNDTAYIYREEGVLWNWYYDIEGFPGKLINRLEISTIGALLKEIQKDILK